MSYQQSIADQLAEAEAFLKDNAEALSEVQCPEQGYGEKEGYELYNDTLLAIAEEEVSDPSGYWLETTLDQTMIEAAGEMSVTTLACWSGKQDHFNNHRHDAPKGTRFVPAKHAAKDKAAAKARARFGIEFCYDLAGRVRQSLPDTEEVKALKVAQVQAKLHQIERPNAKKGKRITPMERKLALLNAAGR